MTPKDPRAPGHQADLMKDLTSLKQTLDEDDDNIPMLLGDEDDVPLLQAEEEDVPLLEETDFSNTSRSSADKASLEAAMRQLESMELAPRARTSAPTPLTTPKLSLEEQIRANAEPPLPETENKSKSNPFLKTQQMAQLELSRRLREEAKRTALISSLNKKKDTAPPPPPPAPAAAPVAPAPPAPVETRAAPATPAPAEEEDAAAEILKELEDHSPVAKKTEAPQVGNKPSAAATPVAPSAQDVEAIIDEIVEEYIIVLEAALRKKLKEKLPDLLKK